MNDSILNELTYELEIYKNKYINEELFAEKDKWLSVLNNISNEILNFNSDIIDWKIRYDLICKILYFFAGRMGSFQEVAPRKLLEESDQLILSTKKYLNFCWEKLGNEICDIDDTELYNIGDEVNLIKYQLMHLTYGGHQEIADFAMNHKYKIIDILERDVSNTPQYLIELDNFKRVARHNSIKRV